jgi:oligopeptide transport system substrate-binding protein
MELLEQLLALTDRALLLFICVFRPETKHGSWRVRETAARLYRHRHTDLWLDPLSAAESETLVGNLLRVGEARPELAEGLPQKLKWRILSHAEGNPLYVEEIIRSLIDSGVIVRDEVTGRWQATRDVADIAIPDTLHGVLMARIDRLQEETKRVLQLAAVVGRIFLYRVLAAIAREERELDEHLLTLQREQMIRERARLPELEYIFKHALTQEAAYNGLLKKERRVFHRQVAEALEELFPDRIEKQVGLLAHHWERAEEPEKATEYLWRAGDQARMAYAHEEATDYYQRALVFLREQGEHERAARTLMKLGLVYTAAFEPDKAQEVYDQAFTLWKPLRESRDLPELRVPVAVLRLAVAEPLGLDPGMVGDDISTFIAAQLFEGLVEVDPDYNVLPAVAARWDVADGGRRYVFRLREGLCWNDGTPLTAADFEYAWKRNLALASRSPVAHLLYVIENARAFGEGEMNDPDKVGVVALDDLTLEIRLEGPTAYLPHLLAHAIAYPLPRWAVEGHGQPWMDPDNLVSNGAYQLVEWRRGEKLVLGKNPFYHGRFPGNAERVECPVVTDFGPVLEAYASDAVDAVSMITADPGTIARAQVAHGRELVFIPQPSTYHLVFRTDRPPFDDMRVRKAFIHAVDRKALAREACQGQYLPATGGFVPPGMPGHSTGIGLAYDPERARGLLARAGHPGGRGFPQVTWVYSSGSPAEPPAVPFLRRAWRINLGLNLEAQSLEWGVFLERRDRDPAHLTVSGWLADYPDPDALLRVLFHSTEGINPPRWHSARFDALVEEAARVADQARRMELYQEADRILVAEEAVIMPLGYARGRILAKPWVTIPRVPPVLMRLRHIVLQREKR